MAWELLFYKDEHDADLISQFLNELPSAQAEKAVRLLEMLEELGLDLTYPTVGFVRNGIHELRTQQGKTNIRFLYARVGKTNFLVLLGIIKYTSKLKEKDIAEAETRLRSWAVRHGSGGKEGRR